MTQKFTDEKNVQILIALLKEKGIKKIVASPGSTNMTFIGSIQNDSFFEIYSVVDERSAAYVACGLAAESGDPVILSCTGATASRNYMSGLTEAYYRKLPILAITSSQEVEKVGHHHAQVTDRSVMPNDVVKHSVNLDLVKDNVDAWSCEVKANDAILELNRRGGGPVHINLNTRHSMSNTSLELPKVRNIERFFSSDDLPLLPKGKIAVFLGAHLKMDDSLIKLLEKFCKSNDAVVLGDHTSGYNGKYFINSSLYGFQRFLDYGALRPDLLIHMGEITGDYSISSIMGKEVWRVNEDGELRDTFRKLKFVFEMSETDFFSKYTKSKKSSDLYLKKCEDYLEKLYNSIPELPFSNIWVAKTLHNVIPKNSVLHFGILSSLRSWNFFDLPESVSSNSNVGGFGIDGCVSSLLGASLVDKNKLYFGFFGDLAFFYDMNSIGNRHVGNNLRILIINNGSGAEFKRFNHSAAQLGDYADEFIAAKGHFGNKSETLVKNFGESLGFEYMSANDKDEFNKAYQRFVTPNSLDKPLIFEVFTNSEDESKALELITSISKTTKGVAKGLISGVLGKENVKKLRRIVKK